MKINEFVDSLAIFGSVARGDADRISDADVLVTTSYPDLQIKSSLEEAGYSPSMYDWNRLQTLADSGSLFVQHLKQEAKVIYDRHDRLRHLLSGYHPNRNYSRQISDNLRLFELTNGVPDSPFALAWAFDVLAVAFRNHAILQMAQLEVYTFGYSELVSQLASINHLTQAESALLLDLRWRKREYRLHPSRVEASLLTLQETQAVVEKITGVNCLSLRLSARDYVVRMLERANDDDHWYCTLRRYEGIHRSIGFAQLNDSNTLLAQLEMTFSSPSPYCIDGAGSTAWVRTNVDRIAYVWLSGN